MLYTLSDLLDSINLIKLIWPWISGFKACVRYFLTSFYFSSNDSPSKTMKNIFHLKSSFRSRDIQVLVFPSSPLFLFLWFPFHCFRAWSMINLKVYDVINCLNKNLITHFVWYLEKEKSFDIETLPIDRVLNKEHFCWKSCRKYASKSSPRPLLF